MHTLRSPLLLFVACLFGCMVSAEVPTLNVVWFDYGVACNNIRIFSAELFTEARVNVTCLTLAELHDVIFPDLRGHNVPYRYDIVIFDNQWLGEAVEDELIYSFNDVIGDPTTRASDFYEQALNAYTEYPPGSGKYWGIPFQADVKMLVVRKDLFEKYNKPYPGTVDELATIAEFFASSAVPEVPYGFTAHWCGNTTAMFGGPCYDETAGIWNQFMWMEGGDLMDEKAYQVEGIVDSDAGVRAVEYVRRLFKAGNRNPLNSFDGGVFDFCSGKAAISMGWSGYAEYMVSDGCRQQCGGTYDIDDVDIIPIPYNDRTRLHWLQLGGGGVHINKRTAYPALAKRFVTFLGSVEYQTKAAKTGSRTIRKSVSANSEFWVDGSGHFSKANAVFFQSYSVTRDFYRLPIYNDLLALEMHYLDMALTEKLDARSALKAMASHQQSIIDKAYPCGSPFAPSLICTTPQPEWNWSLLVLGYCVAVLGSWTASILFEEIVASWSRKDKGRYGWMLLAACVLGGCGFWAHHAIDVSALSYPLFSGASFEPALPLVGLFLSIICCFLGLLISSRSLNTAPARKSAVLPYTVPMSPLSKSRAVPSTSLTPGGTSVETIQATTKWDDVPTVLGKVMWIALKTDRWLATGAIFLLFAIEASLYLIFAGYRSQVTFGSGDIGILAASVIIGYVHVLLAFLLMWHLPKGNLRFLASFVMANNLVLTYVFHMLALQPKAHKAIPAHAAWEPSQLTLGAAIAAALTCFLSMGLNVTRMKLSRQALMLILARNNKEMEGLKSQVEEEQGRTKAERKERALLARALSTVGLCRPRLPNHSVALALAEIASFEATESAAGKSPVAKTDPARSPTSNPARSFAFTRLPAARTVNEDSAQRLLEKLESTISLQSGPVPQSISLQVTINEVLSHPATVELFKDYVRSKHNEESLLFLLDVREFTKLTTKKLKQEIADSIYEWYVQDGAPCQINVSDSMRAMCQKKKDAGDFDCFSALATEARSLMQANDWQGFTETPAYKLCALVLEHPAYTMRDHSAPDDLPQSAQDPRSLMIPSTGGSGNRVLALEVKEVSHGSTSRINGQPTRGATISTPASP